MNQARDYTLIVVCIWMCSAVKATRCVGGGTSILVSCEPGGVLSHVQHLTKILVGLS